MNPASTTFFQLPLIVILPGSAAKILGLSIRERNMRVARRAGARIIEATSLEDHGDQLAMLVRPGAIVDLPLFAAISERSLSGDPSRLVVEGSDAPPIIVGRARDLRPFATETTGVLHLPAQGVPADGLMDGTTRAARRNAAWRILRRTGKPTDGWVSRHVNRPVSRVVSYALLSLRLRANQASIMTLILGFVAALLGSRPGYLAFVGAGILLHLTSVLDGVDGEIARATLTESEAGARLDTYVDRLTYLLCFGGVTVGWAQEVGGLQPLVVGFVVLIALLLSLARGERFVARHAPNASFLLIDRSVRRAARDSEDALLRLAAAGFSLLRRDLFSVIFLVAAFTGRRELIPALLVFGILVANLTFSRYRRQLAAAAAMLEGLPANSHRGVS